MHPNTQNVTEFFIFLRTDHIPIQNGLPFAVIHPLHLGTQLVRAPMRLTLIAIITTLPCSSPFSRSCNVGESNQANNMPPQSISQNFLQSNAVSSIDIQMEELDLQCGDKFLQHEQKRYLFVKFFVFIHNQKSALEKFS